MHGLLLLNGKQPSKELLLDLWDQARLRVCADGAVENLAQYDLVPDVILGDLDSISSKAIELFKDRSLILPMKDQNTTDGEKAIQYCLDQGCQTLSVLGALGKRTDHGLYNLGLLGKWSDIKITLLADGEKIFLIKGQALLNEKIGTTISFMPLFGPVKCVETTGLEFPMNNQELSFGYLSSISNKSTGSQVRITLESGMLLVCISQ
ncbi:MAG: thiamine diphosphokinase [SAR324 cluster bacterium]|uniref:Thiamine diphosphokinase n=1 Tax=SAR324 cluster bacterium TaxID=2024889 RepID=A0A2A4T2A8_9DELT|nr:MAG: thiamine diphosphokinase [SAR324 cluster bacterium]